MANSYCDCDHLGSELLTRKEHRAQRTMSWNSVLHAKLEESGIGVPELLFGIEQTSVNEESDGGTI